MQTNSMQTTTKSVVAKMYKGAYKLFGLCGNSQLSNPKKNLLQTKKNKKIKSIMCSLPVSMLTYNIKMSRLYTGTPHVES